MPDLTISIASYNTKDLLRRCLTSIFKFTRKLNFKVIVVDNASSDGSAAMVKREFPRAKIIRNRVNRWYTGANNQALKLARGRYFLILNSDIFLTTNAFKTMVNYLDRHPQIGAIEPLQLYQDGRIAPTGSRHNTPLADFFELTWLGRKLARQKLLNHFRLVRHNRRHTWPAPVICDAALMTRTDLIKKIGGYDQKHRK
jgi:GT2 family glycosyltransferase